MVSDTEVHHRELFEFQMFDWEAVGTIHKHFNMFEETALLIVEAQLDSG